MFTFIRFANVNSRVCYNTVQGHPTPLLDSQFGFNQHKTQSLNHTFKTHPTVLYSTKLVMLSVIATVNTSVYVSLTSHVHVDSVLPNIHKVCQPNMPSVQNFL